MVQGHTGRAQGSVLGPGPVNTLISDLDKGEERMLYQVRMTPGWEGPQPLRRTGLEFKVILTKWRIGLRSTN